jgi:5'-phosphate synthase pdxT subunit
MDIEVRRNAFGRQVKSFEAPLDIPALAAGKPGSRKRVTSPFPGVFIRAPWIESAGPGVELLAFIEGHPVAARQGNFLVTAFHPELTEDLRMHKMFLEMVQ